jgi:hypothetical protein
MSLGVAQFLNRVLASATNTHLQSFYALFYLAALKGRTANLTSEACPILVSKYIKWCDEVTKLNRMFGAYPRAVECGEAKLFHDNISSERCAK